MVPDSILTAMNKGMDSFITHLHNTSEIPLILFSLILKQAVGAEIWIIWKTFTPERVESSHSGGFSCDE